MRYNVASLLKASPGASRRVEVDAPVEVDSPDFAVVAPVRGVLRMVRDPAGILVEGTLETRVEVACARCLEPVEADLTVTLTEHFRPSVLILDGAPIQADPNEEDEPAIEIDAHHDLDLGPVVAQNIELAVPLHVLCRPDCAGLCPRCGHDRNQGPCDCRPEPDPRWEALSRLIEG